MRLLLSEPLNPLIVHSLIDSLQPNSRLDKNLEPIFKKTEFEKQIPETLKILKIKTTLNCNHDKRNKIIDENWFELSRTLNYSKRTQIVQCSQNGM